MGMFDGLDETLADERDAGAAERARIEARIAYAQSSFERVRPLLREAVAELDRRQIPPEEKLDRSRTVLVHGWNFLGSVTIRPRYLTRDGRLVRLSMTEKGLVATSAEDDFGEHNGTLVVGYRDENRLWGVQSVEEWLRDGVLQLARAHQ